MGEFDLIRRVFGPVATATSSPAMKIGLGDDCAIQQVPSGTELVFSIDTLVEGVHFPYAYNPAFLGWRSLAVAASDLAAMGADPVCFTLALTLPAADTAWLDAFGEGLRNAAESFGLALAGGDTTRGPLSISIQVHGTVPAGDAILRSGARVGDVICVSGTLGDAGAALDWLGVESPPPESSWLVARYHHPVPRLSLGLALRGRASAAIDVSDGLLADLGHLLTASGVGGRIDQDRLPVSSALRALYPDTAPSLAMTAGDDYELCFTLPEAAVQTMLVTDVPVTIIGEVVAETGLWLKTQAGESLVAPTGYDHFGVRS